MRIFRSTKYKGPLHPRVRASKDSKDNDGTRARIRGTVGTEESADISRKTVGAKMATKFARKENTRRMRRMLTILTRRNQRAMNQMSKLADSTCVHSMLTLRKCESLSGSRLELTQAQERRRGSSTSHVGRHVLVKVILFSAQQLENLSCLANNCASMVVTIGEQISEFLRCSSAGV